MTRIRLRCRGAVQGVGFRPTVHRLATELGLTGWVANDPEGATVEVEGHEQVVGQFVTRLRVSLPPLARLDGMDIATIPTEGATTFEVRGSQTGARAGALVPPDATLCPDCREEMEDPGDRRFHYPFTTCTNCGPRFSLVHHLPYDRERTAMACFPLCRACAREYRDPEDRRFHAEPVCCPECGPRLWLADRDGQRLVEGPDAISRARQALIDGRIVAIKGLGGYQLACRADQEQAVGLLRSRKRRPRKPFAVMVRDMEEARRTVTLTAEDERLLLSPRSPVVLAPRRHPSLLAEAVAPDIEDLGVLLPTTPLHVELLHDPETPPLVMTSANLSEEPICRCNREALERLARIADLFLMHDRDVVRRIDDSVVRSTASGPIVVRRARGWVPEPLPLPVEVPTPILAVGGHLQVTACLAVGDQAFLSQHVGDLDSVSARSFLREVIDGLEDFLDTRATLIAADLHADYPSTWLARELAGRRHVPLLQVQHHLAHIAAVLAEHRRFPEPGERCLGIGLDGTGWGPDGTAWGGEWLHLDGALRWSRTGHLTPLPLVGGEQAVREPWRVAAAAVTLAGHGDLLPQLPLARRVHPERLREVARLTVDVDWPRASGAGRLFEACGALVGRVAVNDWEGEAAVCLESLAARAEGAEPWPEVSLSESGGLLTLPSVELLGAAARRLVSGESAVQVAAGFHATFCGLAAQLSVHLFDGSPTVAVGGGCMVNRLLVSGLTTRLRAAGLEPLLARGVPPGDGGLAYGQAALAAVALARNATAALELSNL